MAGFHPDSQVVVVNLHSAGRANAASVRMVHKPRNLNFVCASR